MANDNIFQQYLTPPKSVLDYSADLDAADVRRQTLQQNALALAAERQKQDEFARNREADNHLSRLVGSGQTPDQVAAGLAQAGYGRQALAYTKQQQDLEKDRAQTSELKGNVDKHNFDLREAKRQKAISDIAAFTSPEQALASLQLHEQAGDIAPEQAELVRKTIPQNPNDFPKWQVGMLQRIMSAKDAAGQITPDANAVLSAKTQRDNAIMTDARVRAEGQANRGQSERHFNTTQENGRTQVVQSDNGPVLVNMRTGAGRAVAGPDGAPLPGVTKPLNDGQSKALLFGTRMQEADKVLGQLAGEGTTTSVPGSRTPVIGSIINALSPENQQMLDQAKRDFMTAVLRRESGAAISPSEFDTADKQYFPQPGEGPKQLAQKARNRQLAINGVLVEVPEKQRGAITPKAPAATSAALPSGWSVKEH